MIEFLKADENDVEQLKKLWLECFDEAENAVDLFFDENFGSMRAFCAKDGNAVVSALYLLGVTLNGQKAHYLCGASTRKDYRKKGVMSGLIEFALEKSRQDGDKFSALMPAENSLYNFYSKFGYKPLCFSERRIYTREEMLSFADLGAGKDYTFEELQNITFGKDFLLWDSGFKEFILSYYGLYGAKVVCTGDCFAIFDEDNGCADVFYAVCANENILAKRLTESSNAYNFTVRGKAKGNYSKERYGMIKSLDLKFKIPKDVFIGITLL